MEDKFFEKFIEYDRWKKAMSIAVDKKIDQAELLWLSDAENRALLCRAIAKGEYDIQPPHIAKIPKNEYDENGNMKYRTVYINEARDRVILSILNDMLFETCHDMIHPRCKSYQTGIGCGRVVQEMSRRIEAESATVPSGSPVGFKSDLSKYFDSVPIQYIDECFDMVEQRVGKSCVIDLVRRYYHCDIFLDEDTNVQYMYQSLKQGCAVASFLADAILYHIDEKLSKLDGAFVRYSDDVLFIGKDFRIAHDILCFELEKMQLKVNAKKDELIDRNHWFKFLGFSIKGSSISLSKSRLETLCDEIKKRTARKAFEVSRERDKDGKRKHVTQSQIVRSVMRYLYFGFGDYSWATGVLTIINVTEDINTINEWIVDMIRASVTGKTHVGGLGYVKDKKIGCISRGIGRNVTANRHKLHDLEGYISLGCARNAMFASPSAYQALIRTA